MHSASAVRACDIIVVFCTFQVFGVEGKYALASRASLLYLVV